MYIVEWLSTAIQFVKEYATVIGVFATLLALPLGGKLFYKLATQRIKHLEAEGDTARAQIAELRASVATLTRSLKQATSVRGDLEVKLRGAQSAFDDSNDVWLRKPIQMPAGYDASLQRSIPILVIANLKGGVGKTTLAANLAAYFESRHGERILAIDLDYQGSLSSMLLPESQNREARSAQAVNALIGGTEDANFVFANSSPIRTSISGSYSRLIECDDPFANFETRLLLQWLIGDIDGDIRYNLTSILHSREIQDKFDRVIIDAPPRITTGFVNALCASTHLVVPFVLDVLSAERVGLFLGSVARMRGQLFPRLELGAVIGTMKLDSTPKLGNTEKRAVEEANRRISESWGAGQVSDRFITRKQAIADAAGLKIGYYDSQEVRDIFDPVGKSIYDRTTRRREHESRVA